MNGTNKFACLTLAGALLGGAMLISSPASADVACNRYGECWRVREHYTTYPHNLRVVVRNDAWWEHNRHNRHYRWQKDRDNDRGYYMRGAWRAF